MKKIQWMMVIGILFSTLLSGCIPLVPAQNNPLSEAQIKTAVAGTLAVERAREAGAVLAFTPTPEGTPAEADGTPEAEEGSETPEAGETSDPEPTLEDPWMLQSWCAEHTGCVSYDVRNRTDSWLQIELKASETGVTGFFTVRSQTYGMITLIPGHYSVKYTWWCGEEVGTLSVYKDVASYIDEFKCPEGFYQRLSK